MAYTIAPAAKSILTQATLYRPGRSKASDGTIGDQAHAARVSDHNPDSDGVVLAADLTHDPAHGVDAHGWIRWRAEKGDRRIKYAISNGMWWKPDGRGWRRYTGSNPHTKHVHVSIAKAYANDVSEWFAGWLTDTTPPPPVLPAPPEEDTMYIRDTDTQRVWAVHEETFRWIGAEVFTARDSFVRLTTGKPIAVVAMTSAQLVEFVDKHGLIELPGPAMPGATRAEG